MVVQNSSVYFVGPQLLLQFITNLKTIVLFHLILEWKFMFQELRMIVIWCIHKPLADSLNKITGANTKAIYSHMTFNKKQVTFFPFPEVCVWVLFALHCAGRCSLRVCRWLQLRGGKGLVGQRGCVWGPGPQLEGFCSLCVWQAHHRWWFLPVVYWAAQGIPSSGMG